MCPSAICWAVRLGVTAPTVRLMNGTFPVFQMLASSSGTLDATVGHSMSTNVATRDIRLFGSPIQLSIDWTSPGPLESKKLPWAVIP